MGTLRDATTVLMLAWVFLPAVLFVTIYGALVRIRSWAGWNALLVIACIAAFVGETLFLRWFGMWGGHDIFLLVLTLTAGFAIWQRLWHLFTSTFRRRPKPNDPDTPA